MDIEVYHAGLKPEWDDFVAASRNGTFLHYRDFIEYHGDRFQDCSLVVRGSRTRIAALLPANRAEDAVCSHAGLTYGGFVIGEDMKTPEMLEVFDLTLGWLMENGVRRFEYKAIPSIYPNSPSQEDLYALYLVGAKIVSRDVLPVIARERRLRFQERRRRGAAKARKEGVSVRESEDQAAFWRILTELLSRYSAVPVHSLEEIRYLQEKFPRNIRLLGAYRGEELLGGILIFETERVARTQYIACNPLGKELGALDALFDFLVHERYRDKPFIDLGTTTTNRGLKFNRKLSDQKEGFGARAVVQDRYEMDLSKWKPGSLLRVLE